MKRTYILATNLLVIHFFLYGQSEMIRQLKTDDLVEASFYFYPSTLRALNQGNHPEYNKLIREVKKMTIFRMDDTCTTEKTSEIRSNLIRREGYESLLSLEGKEFDVFVIGKEEPTEYVFFVVTEGERFIVDLLGNIDVFQIPKLFRKISSEAGAIDNGLISLLSKVKGEDIHKSVMPPDTMNSDNLPSKSLEN